MQTTQKQHKLQGKSPSPDHRSNHSSTHGIWAKGCRSCTDLQPREWRQQEPSKPTAHTLCFRQSQLHVSAADALFFGDQTGMLFWVYPAAVENHGRMVVGCCCILYSACVALCTWWYGVWWGVETMLTCCRERLADRVLHCIL